LAQAAQDFLAQQEMEQLETIVFSSQLPLQAAVTAAVKPQAVQVVLVAAVQVSVFLLAVQLLHQDKEMQVVLAVQQQAVQAAVELPL
jgi:hypothetical protein